MQSKSYDKWVKIWLLTGVIMVVVQIVVGGITRLTGSGLSITKWEIVTGTLPPTNAENWDREFDLYKETPQYKKINEGMSMSEFKFIYFWEYIHRLWARSMGFVFAIPFFWFLARGKIDRPLLVRLLGIVGLAAVVASFGWIMVASGLVDRPWVNAYKLTLHLNLGLSLFAFLFLTYLYAVDPNKRFMATSKLRSLVNGLLAVLVVQLLVGGVMSGMKAGLYYPTWPDMNGQVVPASVFDPGNWNAQNFVEYDVYPLAPALTQLVHRIAAYVLAALAIYLFVRLRKITVPGRYRNAGYVVVGVIGAQVVLGIITVVNCVGEIPVTLGVAHQFGAIAVLGSILYLRRYTAVE